MWLRLSFALSVAVLACLPVLAAAKVLVLRAPIPKRIALADCVVRGKIVEIEKKPLRERADDEEREYRVHLVKIDENLLGADGLTHLRLGTSCSDPRHDPEAAAELHEGDEVCLFLAVHAREALYLPVMQGVVVKRPDDKFYERQLEQVRRAARLLKEPNAGLQSKDADDRFLTAAMLLERYRPEGAYVKQTAAIDAEQSRLILRALRDADWKRERGDGAYVDYSFTRLGLTMKDGWQRPREHDKYEPAAKKWLADHADTYRIRRVLER
jgi:hypothetical protein